MEASRIPWRAILSHLTSIGLGPFSLGWKPPATERGVAERVVTLLEDQGLLYLAVDWEHPAECYRTAKRLRDRLTRILSTPPTLPPDKAVVLHTKAIRAALAAFSHELLRLKIERLVAYSDIKDDKERSDFHSALGRLRSDCGYHLAWTAAQYKLNPDSRLAAIFPAVEVKRPYKPKSSSVLGLRDS
jgi:hypothetical protein